MLMHLLVLLVPLLFASAFLVMFGLTDVAKTIWRLFIFFYVIAITIRVFAACVPPWVRAL